MKKIFILLLMISVLPFCTNKVESEKFPQFDNEGKPIVYNEEVYIQMWTKNRDLKVTVVDTFCDNQKAKAIRDIKNGKLIYFGSHPREFKKMTEILSKYGIETKELSRRCLRLGGFEPYCYQDEMSNEIKRKYGKNFIDSIFRVAQKEFILENPNVEYMEDGIDLRKKYKLEKKNSH